MLEGRPLCSSVNVRRTSKYFSERNTIFMLLSIRDSAYVYFRDYLWVLNAFGRCSALVCPLVPRAARYGPGTGSPHSAVRSAQGALCTTLFAADLMFNLHWLRIEKEFC